MVFKELIIFAGISLTKTEADSIDALFYRDYYEEIDDHGMNIYTIVPKYNKFPPNITINSHICCVNEHLYFIGSPIKVYKRIDVACRKFIRLNCSTSGGYRCGELVKCDDCLGLFENGNFDVVYIYNNTSICESFCLNCGYDNLISFKLCNKCGTEYHPIEYYLSIESDDISIESEYIKKLKYVKDEIMKMCNTYNFHKKIELFYLLDDCLSCS